MYYVDLRKSFQWLIFIFLTVVYCKKELFNDIDEKYYLAFEAYNLAKEVILQGRENYESLKKTSLETFETFLDLVHAINHKMGTELRAAIIRFYKANNSLQDFISYPFSIVEIIEIIEHCLINPAEKNDQIRKYFNLLITHFEDVRSFDSLEKCREDLPDEVAAAHCILHQAVILNETMQDNLISIIKIKTRQHAQEMNESLYDVQRCLNVFVPNFFEQLLVNISITSDYFQAVNSSIYDLMREKWTLCNRNFHNKWSPVTKVLLKKPQGNKLFQSNETYTNILKN